MIVFALVSALLLALSVVHAPSSGGFAWDLLNGVGIAAVALLLQIGWASSSPARQPGLDLHAWASVLLVVLVLVHAVGLVVLDPILLEYLEPEAPLYMLVGLASGVGLLVLTITSWPGPRRRSYRNYRSFRSWHRWSWGLLGLGVVWHVVGSGFYYDSALELGLLLVLLLWLPYLASSRRREGVHAPRARERLDGLPALGAGSVVVTVAFALLQQL